MIGKIKIVGQIGSSVDEQGKLVKGFDLVDAISAVRSLPEGTNEILLEIHSPGGYVEVGREISDYFEGLKAKGYKVNSTTIPGPDGRGLVGSIATDIYLSGDERSIDPVNDEFFIHLPRFGKIENADSTKLQNAINAIKPDESKLIARYTDKTGNDAESLRPLMKAETSLSGQKAFELGFATKLKSSQPVFALIKNNMAEKTILQKLEEMKSQVVAFMQGAGAAPTQAVSEPVALEVKTSDGRTLVSDAPDINSLSGSNITENGAPAEGTATLPDGQVLTMVAGKVTQVSKPDSGMPEARIKAIEDSVNKLTDMMSMMVEATKKASDSTVASVNKTIDEKIVALRKDIGTGHTPKVVAFTGEKPKLSPIAQKQKELMAKGM